MAEALVVGVEDSLIIGEHKPLKKKAAKSNGRPAGKVREVFDRVSKLPRRQQEHGVNWISAYVSLRAIQTELAIGFTIQRQLTTVQPFCPRVTR